MKRFLYIGLSALCLFTGCQKDNNSEDNGTLISSNTPFPMMAWIGLSPQSSTEAYQEMKQAGLNYNMYPYYSTLSQVKEALNKMQNLQMKSIVSCSELSTDTEATIRALKDHPAVAGWFMADEPSMKDLDKIAAKMKRFQQIDKKGICYVNFLSIDTSEKQLGASFNAYLEKATRTLPLQMLSSTFYPIVLNKGAKERTVNGLWYKNLEVFSAKAKELRIPLWTLVLSSSHSLGEGGYPEPTLADLRLQLYTNLAYGSQLMQFFTYTTPPDNLTYKAPIAPDGSKNATYYRLAQANAEVQKLSGVFVGAKMLNVWHTGKSIPAGTKRLVLPKNFEVLKTGDIGATVSLLQNGSRYYLMIVNHSPLKTLPLEIKATAEVQEVSKEARLLPVDWTTSKTYTLEAGDMRLFSWTK